ncbi:MAG: hypothetical protein R2729_07230 [Bryobacteraceae bacterium]
MARRATPCWTFSGHWIAPRASWWEALGEGCRVVVFSHLGMSWNETGNTSWTRRWRGCDAEQEELRRKLTRESEESITVSNRCM